MKIFQSSIFRALCAIAVGVLLIKFPDDGVTWITRAIGVLFLISGVILPSLTYFISWPVIFTLLPFLNALTPSGRLAQ